MPTSRLDPLALHKDYNLLSLPDLLEAREKNHVDLMRRRSVVATAVGLYLIRNSDPWPPKKPPAKRGKRTLANSGVRPYSWPCILVFVEKWEKDEDIPWEDRVPTALYLDDRRKVPVCVVEAPRVGTAPPPVTNIHYPNYKIGGGFPVLVEVQERQHVASVGCLVTDGHTTYALTNRHVTGEPGEPVYARFGGQPDRIGVSAGKQLERLPFERVYPDWMGKHSLLNMDIGLIRVDDVNRWSAQIFGIGTMAELADVSVDNLSMRLIDAHVRAYGAASGLMCGAIKALFYRYAAIGGMEYVSDFLIGPRDERQAFGTHPGDSGTVWLLENGGLGLRPIALQWGGHVFSTDDGGQVSCALATSLGAVCRELGVEVIRDWNLAPSEYWGEVGHYTIGALACTLDFEGLPKLQKLMSSNIDRVGFQEDDLKKTNKVLRNQAHYEFVPLADVADEIWRNTRKSDENNHFADMDQKAESGPYKGKTLLELTQDETMIDAHVWSEFYKGTPGTNPGALPFRVWQIYNSMVDYARAGDAVGFLAAAGCLAHYSGDACQPLHISRLHHGRPPVKKGTVAYKVHSVYETEMLNDNAPALVAGIAARLQSESVKATFTGGFGAARRVVQLMRDTVNKLPPSKIVDAYNDESSPSGRLTRLWSDFRNPTMEIMADGCICLAEIWASAWNEGGGEQTVAKSDLGPASFDALKGLYNDSKFLPSVGLDHLADILRGTAAGATTPAPRPRRQKTTAPQKKRAKGRKR